MTGLETGAYSFIEGAYIAHMIAGKNEIQRGLFESTRVEISGVEVG